MAREMRNRSENLGDELGPALDKGDHEVAPGAAVGSKCGFSVAQVTLQSDRSSIVEGMGERGGRVDPVESEITQGQRRKEWRSSGKRMDRRAEVVMKGGQRQFQS